MNSDMGSVHEPKYTHLQGRRSVLKLARDKGPGGPGIIIKRNFKNYTVRFETVTVSARGRLDLLDLR